MKNKSIVNSDTLEIKELAGAAIVRMHSLPELRQSTAIPINLPAKIGHIAVIVHYHQAGPGPFVFDLVFDRSFTKYFQDLLIASAPHADDLANAYG